MKIILLKNVGGVGQQGTIKEVSDGYAFNFLIPRGLGEAATPEKIAQMEAVQKSQEAQKQGELKKLAVLIENLSGARVEVSIRATEKGGLFKSITAADIASTIQKERSVHIPAEAILLSAPIKTTGEHTIVLEGGGVRKEFSFIVKAQV